MFMFHNRIKALFNSAVSSVASGISGFTFHPEKDLTRTKKVTGGRVQGIHRSTEAPENSFKSRGFELCPLLVIIRVTGVSAPGTAWPMSGSGDSISCSVRRISIPKALPPVSIFRGTAPLIPLSVSASPIFPAGRIPVCMNGSRTIQWRI